MDVVEAIRPDLESQARPAVAYIPAASEGPATQYLALTRRAFSALAEVRLIDLASGDYPAATSPLSKASAVYIPGGNSYLLAKRLRESGLDEELQFLARGGMPFVGFSAGAVILGLSIALSNDQNQVGLEDHAGLGLLPFTFAVHYTAADPEESLFRQRLSAYWRGSDARVLALEDGAYLHGDGQFLFLVRGRCHLLENGKARKPLAVGAQLAAA